MGSAWVNGSTESEIVNNARCVRRSCESRSLVVHVKLIRLHNIQYYLDSVIPASDGDALTNLFPGSPYAG